MKCDGSRQTKCKCYPVIDSDGFITQIVCEDGRKEAVWSHDWFI